jgi:mRNA interferase MazF
VPPYVPSKGDYIAVNFDPQSGREQKGRRPALVISNTIFNRRTGFAIVCPLTKTSRGYRLHVPVEDSPNVTGFIMVEQIKSIDLAARDAKRIGTASEAVLEEVLALLDACIY